MRYFYSQNYHPLLSLALFLNLNLTMGAQCGTERWSVKILEDSEAGAINFSPVTSTVHKQLAFTKPPYHENNPRDMTEKKVYKINCVLIQYMREKDSDWHLVVKDLTTNEKMVVEIPDLDCI